MAARRGDTLLFERMPVIASHAAVGGKKEGEGPLAAGFDELRADNSFGRSGWEAAEAELQLRAARLCLKKAQIPEKEVSLVLAGDLQAQCTASNYALRALDIPYAGLFGACSTMAEALGPTGCWPCRPAISARQSVSSAPRSAMEPSAPPQPSGLPPPPEPVCCGPPDRASASAL